VYRAEAPITQGGIGTAPQKPNGGFMKKNLVLLSIAAVIMMASIAFAGAGIGMRINVPFNFYLEDQQFQPGEYSFQMDSGNYATASHLVIWSVNGTDSKMVFSVPGTKQNVGLNELSFNKYGDKYFLSTVSIGEHQATVKMLKMEKELRSQLDTKPATITVAQK
jgi:hypothetical protein